MSLTNYCIIDDEPIAHRIIEGYCKELSHLRKVGNAYNAFEASVMVTKENIDLIFLDINMPKMTGFEWLKTLPTPPKIIVTTAYEEFALEGYELEIVDYLLKPFSFARFLKAVNKALANSTGTSSEFPYTSEETNTKRLFLKGDKMHHQVHMEDILFVEAYGNYCKVRLQDNTIVTHSKISAMELQLPAALFLRVHKSFLVAINKIQVIQGNQIFIEPYKIPIGQSYKLRVNELLRGKE